MATTLNQIKPNHSFYDDRTGKLSFAKIYNTIIIFESLILLGCSLYGLFKFKFDEPIITMTLIDGVFINIYLLFFGLSSLKREDSFQMLLSALVHLFLTATTTMNYFNQPEDHLFNTALLTMFITAAFCQVLYIPLTWLIVSREFGDLIYTKVGGNLDLQRAYKQGLIFFTLLKLDTFLSLIALLLTSARLIDNFVAVENITNIASAVFNIIWVFFGYFVVKKEMSTGVLIWAIFGFVGQPLYLAWKTVSIWTSGFYDGEVFPNKDKILFVFTAICWFVVHFILVIWAVFKVRANFDTGLIDIWANKGLTRDEEAQRRVKAQQATERLAAQARFRRNKDLYGSGLHYSNANAAESYRQLQENSDVNQFAVNNDSNTNMNRNMKQPLLGDENDSQGYGTGNIDSVYVDVNQN